MPITETQIPRPPPERAPILIPFDSLNPLEGPYVNALTHYAHLASQGKLATGTLTRRSPTALVVFLPTPVTGWCLATGKTVTFEAAILTERDDGTVEGWIITTHELAESVFADM